MPRPTQKILYFEIKRRFRHFNPLIFQLGKNSDKLGPVSTSENYQRIVYIRLMEKCKQSVSITFSCHTPRKGLDQF